MPEDEDESDVQGLCDAVGVEEGPEEGGEGEEEGEEVGEGGVGTVVGFCGLFLFSSQSSFYFKCSNFNILTAEL